MLILRGEIMKINLIKESYVNISGNIYDPDFINLANINKEKINFDDNTLFLSSNMKKKLNSQKLEKNDNTIFLFRYDDSYGLIADLDISEYNNENIKCHELVLPDTIQGMIANFHTYNSETAPVFIVHEENIGIEEIIKKREYSKVYDFGNLILYKYDEDNAKNILNLYQSIEKMYVADGHHRLYTTSMLKNKKGMLSCFMSFSDVKILPIHRIIKGIDASSFEKARSFMNNLLSINYDENISKGFVRVTYQQDSFLVKLKEVEEDLFWNNDVYRLNTQIISTAFRILNFSNVEYVLDNFLEVRKKELTNTDVLLEVDALSFDEFTELSKNNCILPPKSTCFIPKFPSFLIFKKYK